MKMNWLWISVTIITVFPFAIEAQTCGGKINLIIGMDSSQSLEKYQYEKITQFTTSMLQRLAFTNLSAVVAFAHQVQLVLDFDQFKEQNAVMMIQTYPHMNIPATRIDLFLSYGTNKFVTDARVNHQIPKVLLLVTDGRNTGTLEGLRQATLNADRNNVDIVTVGVGNSYSQFELLNMATFMENIIESPTFDGLLDDALNKSVDRLCLLSHNGYVTEKVCSGYFVLGIYIDVSDSNFVSTKLFLLDLIGEHIQFHRLYSDIVISVGKVGEIKRFSNSTGMADFISQLQNDVTSAEFDPIHAYQRLRPEFNDQDDFVENIAFFITDKQIHDFDKAKAYFTSTVRDMDNVNVLITGIYPGISPDQLLDLVGGEVMHRVLTTNTSYLTAGRNKLTEALCHIMDESPIEVIVEFSSASYNMDESPTAPTYHHVTLSRYSVDISGTSTVVVRTHSDPNLPNSATAGKDYMPVLQTISFQPGETEKNISVLVLNDGEIEDREQFKMSIVSVTNAKMGKKNATSIFITDKTELYNGPSEVILAFEYCPAPKGKDKVETYQRYMNYVKKVVQHSEVGLNNVQITAETFCEESVTLTSSKSYMPTFHIPYGLQAGGAVDGLEQTLSGAASDVIELLERLRTENKVLFLIFNENYQSDPLLNGVLQQAVSKGITVIPIVLLVDSSSAMSVELPSGFTPYKVYIDTLAVFDYQQLRSYLQQHTSLNQTGWSNIAITTNAEGLTQDTLAHLQKFVSELKKLYTEPASPEIYDDKLQQDLQMYQDKPVTYVVRNTNLPIERMMKVSKNKAGTNILLLMVTGPSTIPGVLETAAKARQMNIKIYVIGVGIDKATEQELRDLSDNNIQLIKSFSFLPLLIFGTGRTIKDAVRTAESTHIMVGIDSSTSVNAADFQKSVRGTDNLIRYWLTYLKNKDVKVTVGLFADHYIDLLTENLDTYNINIQPKLQRPEHLNSITSFSRVMLQMADSLTANQEPGDVTPVAVLVAADTPVSTEFSNRAKDMLTRDGVELITVGINVPLFSDSIMRSRSDVNDDSKATLTAAEIVNKLPSTGLYDILLAVPVDNDLDEATFRWIKRLTLQLTSLLTRKTQLNKFGIITYPSFDHTQEIVPLAPKTSTNIAVMVKNIAQYTRLSPVINTHKYIETLAGLVDTKYSTPPKAAFILLDEDSKTGTSSAIRSASLAAKDFGINMLSIGVGSDVSNSEMEAISYYTKRYTKRLSSHDALESEGLKWTLDVLKTIEPIHLYRQAAMDIQDCEAAADLTFSMDASMSLQENYFDAIKETVIEVVKHLVMSPTAFRIREVTTFDGSIVVIAKDQSDKQVLIEKIAAAELTGGVTKVYLAINRTIQAHLRQPLRNVEKIGVIITDGKSFDPHITRQEAQAAAEANITLIALAIGDELSVSKAELMDVVGNKSENIIWLRTFEELRLQGPSRLHSHICNMAMGNGSMTTAQYDNTTTEQTTVQLTKPTTPESNTTPKIELITDDICAGCPIDSTGFGYVAHPTDCDRYIVCNSQEKIHSINNCPLETFWDTKTTTCNHVHMTICPNDQCKGKPDLYNYTTRRLLEDTATCDEYYTCMDERTSHVCECVFGLQKVYIEGELAEVKYVGKKFDPTSNTCVDDPTGQCSTYIDPNELATPKVFTCSKTKLDDKKYLDDVTNQVVTCPDTYIYKAELCQCVQLIAPPNPGGNQPPASQQACKPFIQFRFDSNDKDPEVQHIPLQGEHDGGIFNGKDTGVQIYRLANNYDNQFTVQIRLQRTGSGDMMIFKNCFQAPTLSLYLEETSTVVNVIAELATISGTLTLSLPSKDIKDNKSVTITLATDEKMAVLYVKNNDGIEHIDKYTFQNGNNLDLSCNSLLTLGGRFEKGVQGFEGLIDEFWWYKGPTYGCTADSFLDSTIVSVVNQ